MKKLFTLLAIVGCTVLASSAAVTVINATDSPIKTTYKCQYRDCSCKVFVNTYPLLKNSTSYNVVCSGEAMSQGKYRNISRSDVERKRFRYCQLEDVQN